MSAPKLLHYRSWRGEFRGPIWTPWPIARAALALMFHRKLFWALYGFALLSFLMFFFGQFLLAWAEAQAGEQNVPVLGVRMNPGSLIRFFRVGLRLDGGPESYRLFFTYQGYMVMAVLALAGAVLVGNDFEFGSLPFYLAKPLAPAHYVLGKCLAVAVFVHLMTTLPALVLFFQYRVLQEWDRLDRELLLLGGILAYGMILSSFLSLMLVTTASALQRTVPMVMAWTALFYFLRQLTATLVDRLGWDVHWRLLDLWGDACALGDACLGLDRGPQQPPLLPAFLTLGVTSLLCLTYLSRRIRAVEIVR